MKFLPQEKKKKRFSGYYFSISQVSSQPKSLQRGDIRAPAPRICRVGPQPSGDASNSCAEIPSMNRHLTRSWRVNSAENCWEETCVALSWVRGRICSQNKSATMSSHPGKRPFWGSDCHVLHCSKLCICKYMSMITNVSSALRNCISIIMASSRCCSTEWARKTNNAVEGNAYTANLWYITHGRWFQNCGQFVWNAGTHAHAHT